MKKFLALIVVSSILLTIGCGVSKNRKNSNKGPDRGIDAIVTDYNAEGTEEGRGNLLFSLAMNQTDDVTKSSMDLIRKNLAFHASELKFFADNVILAADISEIKKKFNGTTILNYQTIKGTLCVAGDDCEFGNYYCSESLKIENWDFSYCISTDNKPEDKDIVGTLILQLVGNPEHWNAVSIGFKFKASQEAKPKSER